MLWSFARSNHPPIRRNPLITATETIVLGLPDNPARALLGSKSADIHPSFPFEMSDVRRAAFKDEGDTC
jgi:hypothetical protein